MSKTTKYETKNAHNSVVKKTKQGGIARTSGMNKHEKSSYKKYRVQGR